MKINHWFFLQLMRLAFNITCKIDSNQLSQLPKKGPAILITNHVNFLEMPVMYMLTQNWKIAALVKFENWQNFIIASLFERSKMIPVHRGEPDRTGLRLAQQSLDAGNMLAVLPEGTRDNGQLKKGYPGVSLIALRAKVPIWPLVFYGGEFFWRNLSHFKRTDFHIVVGNPFHLSTNGDSLSRDVVQEMADELMYQLAALLPSSYRGLYSDFTQARQTYLHFDPGVTSNLERSIRSGGKIESGFRGDLSPQL